MTRPQRAPERLADTGRFLVRRVSLEGSHHAQRRLLLEHLAALPQHVRLVARTTLTTRRDLRVLLRTGVHGLVCTDAPDEALEAAAEAVALGQLSFPDRLWQEEVSPPLSVRQRQVLALLVMGLTNGEIAARLHIEPSTVKTHVRTIFEKLGVRSRAEALDVVTDPAAMLETGVVRLAR